LLLERYAWLSASRKDSQPYQIFTWPDGTDIHNCASQAKDVQEGFISDGPATMLSENNVISRSGVGRNFEYPVLCFKD
jgi:hypothetical protein